MKSSKMKPLRYMYQDLRESGLSNARALDIVDAECSRLEPSKWLEIWMADMLWREKRPKARRMAAGCKLELDRLAVECFISSL